MNNYPPGVRESDIPGHRPQDVIADRVVESITDDDLLDSIIDTGHAVKEEGFDHTGCCVFESPITPGMWALEVDESFPLLERQRPGRWGKRLQYLVLEFDSQWDALAYALEFHEAEIRDAVEERKLEEARDDYYGF